MGNENCGGGGGGDGFDGGGYDRWDNNWDSYSYSNYSFDSGYSDFDFEYGNDFDDKFDDEFFNEFDGGFDFDFEADHSSQQFQKDDQFREVNLENKSEFSNDRVTFGSSQSNKLSNNVSLENISEFSYEEYLDSMNFNERLEKDFLSILQLSSTSYENELIHSFTQSILSSNEECENEFNFEMHDQQQIQDWLFDSSSENLILENLKSPSLQHEVDQTIKSLLFPEGSIENFLSGDFQREFQLNLFEKNTENRDIIKSTGKYFTSQNFSTGNFKADQLERCIRSIKSTKTHVDRISTIRSMRSSKRSYLEKFLRNENRNFLNQGLIKTVYSKVLPSFSKDERWCKQLQRFEAIHVLGFKGVDFKFKDVLPGGTLAKMDRISRKITEKAPILVKTFRSLKRYIDRINPVLLKGASSIVKFAGRFYTCLTVLDIMAEIISKQCSTFLSTEGIAV